MFTRALKRITQLAIILLTCFASAADWVDPVFDGSINEMLLVPDGKLLVFGEFTAISGNPALRLVRLNPDGSLDQSFDATSFLANSRRSHSIAVNLDGTILISVSGPDSSTPLNLLAKLNEDGILIPGFMSPVPYGAQKIWVDGHGRITLRGRFSKSSIDEGWYNNYSDHYLLRDGSPNPFSTLPWPTKELISSNLVSPIVVRHDGAILATSIIESRSHLYMFTADRNFPVPNFETNVFGTVYSVIFDLEDRLIVSANIQGADSLFRKQVVRLTPDGRLDTSFPEQSFSADLLQLSSGKYLIGNSVINEDGSLHSRLLDISSGGKPVEMPDQSIVSILNSRTVRRRDAPATTSKSILIPRFSTVAIGETNLSLRIPLQLFGNYEQERTVSYEVRDGTYSFPVGASRGGVLVFPSGTSFAYLDLPLNAVNDMAEENRTFTVELIGTDTVEIPPGRSTITVTIYDDDTGLLATFYESNTPDYWWEKPPVPLDFGRKAFEKRVGQINYVWIDHTYGGPTLTNRVGFYAIHFQGMIVPEQSGTYTFHARGDDGVRLWVDNEHIVNDWEAHPSLEFSGQIDLEAGVPVPISFHYFQRMMGSMCALSWTPPGGQKEIIPQRVLRPVPLPVAPISLQNFRLNEDGSTTVSLLGTPGAVYNAEVSTNLTSPSWQFLQNIIPTNGTTIQLYTPSTNQHLWLRAVQH